MYCIVIVYSIPGIPAQGRSFKLRNVSDNEVGSFAGGHGEPGPLIGEKGTLAYIEVLSAIFTAPFNSNIIIIRPAYKNV